MAASIARISKKQPKRSRISRVGWRATRSWPGEPITESKIVAPGSRGFLAAVLRPACAPSRCRSPPPPASPGFVFPGDQVDIVITETSAGRRGQWRRAPAQGVPRRYLHDVRVLAVDQKLESKGGEAVVAQTATLEVTPKQSEIIAVASEMGKLSLSLRSLVDSAGRRNRRRFCRRRRVGHLHARQRGQPAVAKTLHPKG